MRKIYYTYDNDLTAATQCIPNIKIRSQLSHALIQSYDLMKYCTVLPCVPASDDDLLSFHSQAYLEFIRKAQNSIDQEKLTEAEEFNLEYDCPLFSSIYSFCKVIAGGSLTAAKLLIPKDFKLHEKVKQVQNSKPRSYLKFKETNVKPIGECGTGNECANTNGNEKNHQNMDQLVSINWCGGWHHAQRDNAEGFCYVNDIVIAIQHLLTCYSKILYVDLDVHHGNGVENAFVHSRRVMTLSIHKHSPGYYPGTGSIDNIGIGPGRFYTINVPLNDGITDEPYCSLFYTITNKIKKVYNPDCIVLQCGADSLANDPLGGFNLTLQAFSNCLNHLLNWQLPCLILGGGGYNLTNAARHFTNLTATILKRNLSNDIPEHKFFNFYGPGFELEVNPTLSKDKNTTNEIANITKIILDNLNNLQPHSES